MWAKFSPLTFRFDISLVDACEIKTFLLATILHYFYLSFPSSGACRKYDLSFS